MVANCYTPFTFTFTFKVQTTTRSDSTTLDASYSKPRDAQSALDRAVNSQFSYLHHSLSFPSPGLTTWIPQAVYCYFLAYPFLVFLFHTF